MSPRDLIAGSRSMPPRVARSFLDSAVEPRNDIF
ncbi:MAG: palindromic element RPE4 domain-containing protein [Alphaproteobacteria bacterium]|nr:MAG: palindromic element RPE4 domain-containing protein [Alphaproteobacteria bacterium]